MNTNLNTNFLDFLFNSKVIQFGDFVTKIGRKTPYFLNFGNVVESHSLFELCSFYSHEIIEITQTKNIFDLNIIFGSAYKGIPLAIAISYLLSSGLFIPKRNENNNHNNKEQNNNSHVFKNISFAFNRKEAKDHGEKGILIGKAIVPEDKVVIIDDVLTSGKSILESIEIIKNNGNAKIPFVVVGIDRQEKSLEDNNISAKQMIEKKYNIPVVAISNLNEILVHYKNKFNQEKISEYLKKNCIGIKI